MKCTQLINWIALDAVNWIISSNDLCNFCIKHTENNMQNTQFSMREKCWFDWKHFCLNAHNSINLNMKFDFDMSFSNS